MSDCLTLGDILTRLFGLRQKEFMTAQEAERMAREVNLTTVKTYIEERASHGDFYCLVREIFPENIKILKGLGYTVECEEIKRCSSLGSDYETRYKISWGEGSK